MPEEVRWFAEIVESDGIDFWMNRTSIDIHKCTQEDFTKFHRPKESSRVKIEEIQKQGELLCLADRDVKGRPFKVYGNSDVKAHRRIDLRYLPCEPVQLTEENKHLKDKECLVDLRSKEKLQQKLKETELYLGDPHLTLVYNTERFDVNDYGKDAII